MTRLVHLIRGTLTHDFPFAVRRLAEASGRKLKTASQNRYCANQKRHGRPQVHLTQQISKTSGARNENPTQSQKIVSHNNMIACFSNDPCHIWASEHPPPAI